MLMSHGKFCVSTALGWALLSLLSAPNFADAAQEASEETIGPFVIDLRASIAPFGHDTELANPRGFNAGVTPGLGLGFETGAQLYVYQWRMITLGAGGSVDVSFRDRKSRNDDHAPNAPTIRKHFIAFSPQLSLNFGNRNGWSYLSGGIGLSRLSLSALSNSEPQRRTNTINYGGGARWFTSDHLALSIDLRFYALSPLLATDNEAPSPRTTLMVLSIGTSFK